MKIQGLLLLLILTSASIGCEGMMHELQPHRLWRLNYQENNDRSNGVYMSIDDPLPPKVPVPARSAAFSPQEPVSNSSTPQTTTAH